MFVAFSVGVTTTNFRVQFQLIINVSVYFIIAIFCYFPTYGIYAVFEPVILWSYAAFPRSVSYLV